MSRIIGQAITLKIHVRVQKVNAPAMEKARLVLAHREGLAKNI